MRDNLIYAQHEANARRNALLFEQFEFLNTRQEAFERVIRTSTLRNRLLFMFKPTVFFQVVDAVQRSMLQANIEKLNAIRNDPKNRIVKV